MSLARKNKSNRLVWLFIALLIAADLISKHLIFASEINNQLITPVVNTGGARSLNIGMPIIIGVTGFACAAMIYLWAKRHITTAAFALLFAGAIGNVYDRIMLSGVRDRIHIASFPVFNLADIMITIGVLIIAWEYKQSSRNSRNL